MLKVAFSEIFLYKVPEKHRFPMQKYHLIPQRLVQEGTLSEANFFAPDKVTEQEILTTHTAEYWHKLKTQTLPRKEARAIGFEMTPELVERGRYIAHATYECALYAKQYGVSLNVAGGTHHSFADHGKPPIEVHVYGVVKQEEALYPPKHLLDQIAAAEATNNTDETEQLLLTAENNTAQTDHVAEEQKTADNLVADTSSSNPASKAKEPTSEEHPAADEDKASIQSSSEALTETDPDTENKDTSGLLIAAETETEVGEADTAPQDSLKDKDKTNPKSKLEASKLNDMGFTKRLRRPKAEPIIEPNFVVFAVIDQGSGIPLDKREEIFSPFVRLQQQKKGSGLGLSLVAQIVEAHNGRIRSDTYNGHTRFIVLLPVNDSVTVEKPTFT